MTSKNPVSSVLIDRRNITEMLPVLMNKMKNATLIGFDTETEDVTTAHPGIVKFRGKDTADAFDWQRIIVCGFSMYFDDNTYAYYFNMHHADVENRLTWEDVKDLL